jgi:hypothetical protein
VQIEVGDQRLLAMLTTANRGYASVAMQGGTESPAGQVVR